VGIPRMRGILEKHGECTWISYHHCRRPSLCLAKCHGQEEFRFAQIRISTSRHAWRSHGTQRMSRVAKKNAPGTRHPRKKGKKRHSKKDPTFMRVMSHDEWLGGVSYVRHVTRINVSCHTWFFFECVRPDVRGHSWRMRVTHTWMRHAMYEWVMSYLKESYMSRVNVSVHPYEWVMSHMNESCHIWMSHGAHEWVKSHI